MIDINTEVLKLPLGFIRVVELPMILIAFASMSGWGISFKYTANCGDKPVPKEYHVNTFKLDHVMIASNSCIAQGAPEVPLWGESYGPSSAFFIFTGIVSLLFVLGTLAVYLFLWGSYGSDNRMALMDFLITVSLAGCWLIATILWWAGANGVGYMTKDTSIHTQLTFRDVACGPPKSNNCSVTVDGGYGSLVISILAGWSCVVLFMANCWFVYKETVWFSHREASRAYADAQDTSYASPSHYVPQQAYQR